MARKYRDPAKAAVPATDFDAPRKPAFYAPEPDSRTPFLRAGGVFW